MKGTRLAVIAAFALLGACAGPGPMRESRQAAPEPRHQRDFAENAERVCAAARHALMAEGYLVQRHGEDGFVGARESHVETEAKEDGYSHFRVYVTCVARAAGTTLFVTATDEHFGVKALRESTLIGLPLVSPISVGTRTEGEQQVKFRGETVERQEFYDDFYRAVRQQLKSGN